MNRKLDHNPEDVLIQHDHDFYSAALYKGAKWMIYFFKDQQGEFTIRHDSGYSDWYITVACEKLRKIKNDTHLITHDLIMSYRWAIREGYNHLLDPHLKNDHDQPRHRNTIEGVQ